MPAISFSGTTSRGPFYVLILKREKTQTCRKPRKRPIKKGDKLVLYWKQRVSMKPPNFKPIHKIAVATCVDVERKKYREFAFDDDFARRDGFKDAEEMQEWFGDPLEYADEEYDVIHFVLPYIPPRREDESMKPMLPKTKTAKDLYDLIFLAEESGVFSWEQRKELVKRALKYLTAKYGSNDDRTIRVKAMTFSDFTNIDMNEIRFIMHNEIGREEK